MIHLRYLLTALVLLLLFANCNSDSDDNNDNNNNNNNNNENSNELLTYIPDDVFEQFMIDIGYDTQLDNYINTEVIEGVEELDLTDIPIANLTGLEDFTALRKFKIRSFELINFDPSPNTNLRYLSTNGCLNLTSLNVSNLPLLDTLYMSNNNSVLHLDVSQNVNLKSFHVIAFNLESLILPQLPAESLTDLIVNSTKLPSLDLSEYDNLISVELKGNEFTQLDLSSNPNLISVKCPENLFTSFNLANGANQHIEYLDATTAAGGLNCIKIDMGFTPPENGNWLKDPQTSYAEDCN
jgi:hypothetical protein